MFTSTDSSVPSSATTVMRRPPSSSSIRTTPEWWASTAAPFGVRASNSSTTRGKAVGDVLTHHPTGVEGPHGQLGARLTDGLGGDDPHRFNPAR